MSIALFEHGEKVIHQDDVLMVFARRVVRDIHPTLSVYGEPRLLEGHSRWVYDLSRTDGVVIRDVEEADLLAANWRKFQRE